MNKNLVYHISNALYNDLRPLKLQPNSKVQIDKMLKDGYSFEYVTMYSKEVNFFISPISKEHIDTMVEHGFKNWDIPEHYIYVVDLNTVKDYNYISVTSTPEQREYDEMHWNAFLDKYGNHYDNKEWDIWKIVKKGYYEDRDKWLLEKYNIKAKMDIYEFTNHKLYTKWANFKEHFKYNLEHGSKKQYASFIPHIQLSVNKPIQFKTVELITNKKDLEEFIYNWSTK